MWLSFYVDLNIKFSDRSAGMFNNEFMYLFIYNNFAAVNKIWFRDKSNCFYSRICKFVTIQYSILDTTLPPNDNSFKYISKMINIERNIPHWILVSLAGYEHSFWILNIRANGPLILFLFKISLLTPWHIENTTRLLFISNWISLGSYIVSGLSTKPLIKIN